VAKQLEAGERTYNGSALTRPLAELGRELEEEAEDLAGWAFWIWMRVARLQRELEVSERSLQPVAGQEQHDGHAEPDVRDQLGDDHPLGLPSGKGEDGLQVGEQQPAHGGNDRASGPADQGDRAARALPRRPKPVEMRFSERTPDGSSRRGR
jgi:hypothetical protein